MNDEHKSEIVTNKIKIGHLFDITLEFLEKFFPEEVRLKKKDPRIFSVPSEVRKHFDWKIMGQILPVPNSYPQIGQPTSIGPAIPTFLAAYPQESKDVEGGYKPKTSPTHYLCIPLATKPGPAIIVDEIKTGTRAKFYRVWLNGEDRYFTETQLKYAMEVK